MTQFVPVVVQLFPPGVAFAVYPVTSEPPSDAGAVQDTRAALSPVVAPTAVGAPGVLAFVSVQSWSGDDRFAPSDCGSETMVASRPLPDESFALAPPVSSNA